MENGFTIESNWKSSNKKDIKDAISIKYWKNYDKESFDLDEIVSEEKAVLLECETSTICEVLLKVDHNHSIQNITIVMDCPKLELFKGKQQEYVNTYFGDILDDFAGVRVYRFDVTIDRPTDCELLIRLLPGITQIWIYGMLVVLHQQSSLPKLAAMPKINFLNVQEILANSKVRLTASAESFLHNYMANRASVIPPKTGSVQFLNSLKSTTDTDIKTYLDERMKELEIKIDQRLMQMEQRQESAIQKISNLMEETVSARLTQIESSQNAKLSRISEILEDKTNS